MLLFFCLFTLVVYLRKRERCHTFFPAVSYLSRPLSSSGLNLSEATPSLTVQPLRVCVCSCVCVHPNTHTKNSATEHLNQRFHLFSPHETYIHIKAFCFIGINLSQLSSLFFIFLFYCWNKAVTVFMTWVWRFVSFFFFKFLSLAVSVSLLKNDWMEYLIKGIKFKMFFVYLAPSILLIIT